MIEIGFFVKMPTNIGKRNMVTMVTEFGYLPRKKVNFSNVSELGFSRRISEFGNAF